MTVPILGKVLFAANLIVPALILVPAYHLLFEPDKTKIPAPDLVKVAEPERAVIFIGIVNTVLTSVLIDPFPSR